MKVRSVQLLTRGVRVIVRRVTGRRPSESAEMPEGGEGDQNHCARGRQRSRRDAELKRISPLRTRPGDDSGLGVVMRVPDN